MMETVDANICRTCLGPLEEAPKNLFDGQFADALELLRGFVVNLVDFQTEDVLNICSFCYEKLDFICKFREQCQKSFKEYMEIKNKKDPVISNLGQIFEDDYIAAKIKIDLDNENLEETITIYKNSDETNGSETAIEPRVESAKVEPQSTSNNTKRGSRAKQFPAEDVLTSIDECNSFQTAYDKRKCIHCEYVTKTNRQLCIHMKHKHAEELRTWCSRCNIQTSDLEEHTKTVQCCEYVCKFCNKKCRRLFMLMAHLKSHASEHFCALARKAKQEAPQQQADKIDVAPQPQSLQPLSNVVFQYSAAASNVKPAVQPTVIAEPTNNNTAATANKPTSNTQTIQTITADGKIKVSRVSKQYDSALVLQALAECTNYMKDMKNRTCGQCSIITSLASGMNGHMFRTHSEVYPQWCKRCNIVTENLQAHKDLVNCDMYQCKFCEKAFNKVNKLTKHMQCHCHEIFRNKATTNNVEEEPTVQLQSLTSVSNDHQQSGDSMPILENTDGNMAAYESSQQEFQFYTAVSTDVNMTAYQDSSQEQDTDSFTAAENTDGTGLTFESAETTDGNITYESLGAMNAKMAYESFAADADKYDMKAEEAKSDDRQIIQEMTESSSMDELKEEMKTQDSFLSYATTSNGSYAATPYDDSGDTDDPDADSAEDAPGWALLDQIAPADVVRALTTVRKPVHVHNTCAICKSVMTDNRGLSLHMTIVHKEEKGQWCRTCNELFDDIDKHKEIHAPKCEFCNKTFIFLSHLRTHLKNHARNHDFNTSTWLTCKVCSSSFPDEDSLKTHECTPDPSKVDHKKCRTYCEVCNEAVPVIKDHMIEKHNTNSGSSNINLCPICGKFYTSAYELNVHMRKHIAELPFKCSHCDKCFAEKYLLTNHEKIHAEDKQILCQICNKAFVDSKELECHMTTHTGKPLKCQHCEKSFFFKTQLSNHLRTHPGEKPHMCTYDKCSRTFANKSALASHFRQTHTEERPFKCTHCDMTFKIKSTMKNHEFIHTGIKPFKCNECPYSARQNHRLTAHMKVHQLQAQEDAAKPSHTCVFCQERFPTHLQLISHTYAKHGEMPMEGVVNNIDSIANTSAQHTPNVVNITSHHIIIQDGNSSQTIQISGLDMGQPMDTSRISESNLTQLVAMESSSTSIPPLTLEDNVDNPMEGSVTMDDLDQVPIQIVYKPQGLG